jgi:hypothetical protein
MSLDTTTENDGLDELDEPEVPETPETPEKPPTDDLRAAMTELAGIVKGQVAPKKDDAPAELTQEQKDELWAVYNPEKKDPKFLDKFFRLTEDMTPEQKAEFKALFADLQQGLVKQSVVGARNLMQIELAKLREEFAPAQEYISEARAERTRGRFFDKYESLKDPRYAKIIAITAKDLSSREFKDEGEYFKALAEGAAETIAGVEPTFALGAVKTKQTPGTTPRLPRTSVGGTGGAGGGKQAALSVKGDATDDFLED